MFKILMLGLLHLFYSTAVLTWRVAHLLRCIGCYISIDWYRFTIAVHWIGRCFPSLCVITANKPQRSTYGAWPWRRLINHLTIYPRFAFVPQVRFHEDSFANCEFITGKLLWCSFVIVGLGVLFPFRNVLGHHTWHCQLRVKFAWSHKDQIPEPSRH